MPTPFQRLLEATLAHLRELRAQGVAYVLADPDLLAALKAETPRRPKVSPSPAESGSTVRANPPTVARRGSDRPASSPSGPPAPSTQSPFPGLTDAPASAAAATATGGLPVVLSPSEKAAAMDELRTRALVCQKCPHLARARTQVVFGVGDIDAELMFVGEAPGADEDAQGEPFVGRAGQLLTKIIETMGVTRATVYIGNVLKCRPDMPPGSSGNRAPTVDEMETCKPYLLRQIELIQPKVIVALGATAVLGLLGLNAPMSSLRGRWQSLRGIPVMPTFHPSYLLRNQALEVKRKVWEDMLLVLARLGRPITDKMQGYFLSR